MNILGTSSRADDHIASYSSKGPTLFDHIVKPDLVAPGNRIIISLYTAALTLKTFIRQRNSQFFVSSERDQHRFPYLLLAQWYEHGNTDGEWRGGSVVAKESDPHS